MARPSRDAVARSSRRGMPSVQYGRRYRADDGYEYTHVHVRCVSGDTSRLLSAGEWKALGVDLPSGWEHYTWHEPEPHVLLFRRVMPIACVELRSIETQTEPKVCSIATQTEDLAGVVQSSGGLAPSARSGGLTPSARSGGLTPSAWSGGSEFLLDEIAVSRGLSPKAGRKSRLVHSMDSFTAFFLGGGQTVQNMAPGP